MDRVIKFRGKGKYNGEWVYGSPLRMCYGSDERFYIALNPCNVWHFKFTKADEKYESGVIEVIPETIGQFTGFTDLNKKEWFEHDITEGGYVVKFFNGGWACYKSENNWFPLDEDNAKYKKIIGNTHDKEEVKND